MNARVTQKPLFGRFVFVDVEVVQHYLELARRVGLHDIIHETQEVDRRPPVSHVRDHLAGGNLQGGQQGLPAMADVFVSPGARFFGPQGQ